MELQLCLALTNPTPKVPIMKELDLISYVNYEPSKRFGDDNSTLSSQSSVNGDYGDQEEVENDGLCLKNGGKKRGFDEVEGSVCFEERRTLPLFLWDKEPNDEDMNPKRVCNSTILSINRNEGEAIVGWPPVKSYRKNVFHQEDAQLRHRRGNFPAVENGGRRRSMFVKVQMEGFMLTRKIDLKLHQSYESLTCSLLTMFGKGHDSVADYKLTYQDKEGDWLLGGDVPWRTFNQSVQRLKLLKRDA